MFIVRYLFDEENHIIKEKKFDKYKLAYNFAKDNSLNSACSIFLDGKEIVEFQFGEEYFNCYSDPENILCPICDNAAKYMLFDEYYCSSCLIDIIEEDGNDEFLISKIKS